MSTVYLYTHTHWDREWYQPFEAFRVQLVAVVKSILDQLEDGSLSRFYLDGQAIVIEDVVEIEPQLGERISKLMHSGKLAAGPWYVLPDQMLVSGESLVRNILLGIRTVEKYGAPSLTGYNPDTFGHTHDLPRILQGFGIDSAFVWRGVPRLQRDPFFWWQSPDGSKVLAWHFSRGYYQTLFHEVMDGPAPRAVQVMEQLKSYFAKNGKSDGTAGLYCELIDGGLFPCGADHTRAPIQLDRLIEECNANAQLRIQPVQLDEFSADVIKRVTEKPTVVALIDDELRDNSAARQYCNAFLLPGVLSTRLYLKRQNRLAEYRLARFTEPLCSLLRASDKLEYPHTVLERAWRLLLKNHPHDSICGCSVDAVHDEMEARTQKLMQILDVVSDQSTRVLAREITVENSLNADLASSNINRVVVANPSGRAYSGVIPFSVAVPAGHQFEPAHDRVQILSKATNEELFSGWGKIPNYQFVDKYVGWFWCEDLPACGIKSYEWPSKGTAAGTDGTKVANQKNKDVKLTARSLDNGLVKLTVLPSGQLKVVVRGKKEGEEERFSLVHEFRDVGDAGDTYNFDPIEGDTPIMSEFASLEPGLAGPLVASLVLNYSIKLPECCIPVAGNSTGAFKRSKRLVTHKLRTEVFLKKGSPIVSFETSWNNNSRDHRLEVLFYAGEPIKETISENHFSVMKRVHSKGKKETLPVSRGDESRPDRFPTQRFVIANQQLFLNKGLPEYGVDGNYIAHTILRSVGILSRGPLRTRGGGAGPHIDTPGAQCIGENKVSYAWAPLPKARRRPSGTPVEKISDNVITAAYDIAEEYESEFLVKFANDRDEIPQAYSLLSSDNQCVRMVAMYCDSEQRIFARFLNVSVHPQSARIFMNADHLSPYSARLDESVGTNKLPVFRDDQRAEYVEVQFGKNELRTICLQPM